MGLDDRKDPPLEATKVQARVVIPIVKLLEKEIGKARAHATVGAAIAYICVKWRVKRGFERNVHPADERDNSPDFPVERKIVENTPEGYGHNVTGCAIAAYFRSICEPEIGPLVNCGVDFAAAAHMRSGWEFSRTQTLIQGPSHCDFRWKRA